MFTILDTKRVKERFFYCEVMHWRQHPLQTLDEEWDDYQWKKACQFLLDEEWEGFHEWLMNHLTETYVKEGMLLELQYASPRLYAWMWMKCAVP